MVLQFTKYLPPSKNQGQIQPQVELYIDKTGIWFIFG